jgi:hypothetical protein
MENTNAPTRVALNYTLRKKMVKPPANTTLESLAFMILRNFGHVVRVKHGIGMNL